MEKWNELWLKNYRGEGDTQDLQSSIKKLNYGNRNNISYLPWATVERIFRLQGGTIEIMRSNRDTIVEADQVCRKEEFDGNGSFIREFSYAFFVNIKVEWQGQTHIEKYPLQDSSGRAISNWTQNEVNKAIQRGKVKAIAVISGIGFKLFEDGDLQFEEETILPSPQKPKHMPKAKVESTPSEEPTNTKEVEPEVVEEPTTPTKEETIENRVELENEIKKQFLSGSTEKAIAIKNFLANANVKKMGDLSDAQVKTLFDLIK